MIEFIITTTSFAFAFCVLFSIYSEGKRNIKQQSTLQQSEQPEQNSPEPERPNVYYSKDIQIISEPAYLTPPFRYSEVQRITVERLQDKTVLLCCLLDGNLLSIKIKDITIHSLVEACETEILENPPSSKHRTKPVDIVTDYLFGVKIFKI